MQEWQVPSRLFAGLNQLVRSTGMLLASLGFWGHFIHALPFLKLGPRAALHAPLSSGPTRAHLSQNSSLQSLNV